MQTLPFMSASPTKGHIHWGAMYAPPATRSDSGKTPTLRRTQPERQC
jgi:hypothetical protein